ncbi:MAG: class I SAM-dependent methyltransferase [Gaiellaceae bacterium]
MSEFDRTLESYEEAVEHAIAFSGRSHAYFLREKARRLLDVARRTLGDLARVRALDVGCGPGTSHAFLAPLGDLVGVDESAQFVAAARRQHPERQYLIASGESLPFDDASFDLAFTVCVLHHVPSGERQAFANELVRVVRPGGIVAVLEHNPLNPLTRFVVGRCEFDEDAELLRMNEVEDLLSGAGAVKPERAFMLFTPWPAPRLERILARLPLGAQYLVAATR